MDLTAFHVTVGIVTLAGVLLGIFTTVRPTQPPGQNLADAVTWTVVLATVSIGAFGKVRRATPQVAYSPPPPAQTVLDLSAVPPPPSLPPLPEPLPPFWLVLDGTAGAAGGTGAGTGIDGDGK